LKVGKEPEVTKDIARQALASNIELEMKKNKKGRE